MRQIEKALIVALLDENETANAWSRSNTSMAWGLDESNEQQAHVYLHGNHIASWTPATEMLWITDAGWQTVTTKSRLNALLAGLGCVERVVQEDFDWYLRNTVTGKAEPFNTPTFVATRVA